METTPPALAEIPPPPRQTRLLTDLQETCFEWLWPAMRQPSPPSPDKHFVPNPLRVLHVLCVFAVPSSFLALRSLHRLRFFVFHRSLSSPLGATGVSAPRK